MFCHEPAEVRVRHLFDWFDSDNDTGRMLPMSGLSPLTSRHGMSFRMELTTFDMEIMAAQMSLVQLIPTNNPLILRVFTEALDAGMVENFIKYIVWTPSLTASPSVLQKLQDRKDEEFDRYRKLGSKEMDSFEWEPARQNDPIYFDFLLLGPVALLLALLVSGQPAIRQKLEEPDSWQKVKPQLSFIRAIPECPEGLRSACDKCITLIDQPPATSVHSCAFCGVGGKLFKCTRCHSAWYCGRDHQRADWKLQHKLACKRGEQKSETSTKQKRPAAPTGEGRKEIQKAIDDNDVEGLRALLQRFHPDTPLEFGPGLNIAALQGRLAVAQVFLDEGAHVDAQSATGETPLMLACMYGRVALAELFLQRGAAADVFNVYGKSLLTVVETQCMGDDQSKLDISKMVKDALQKQRGQ